MAISTFKKLLLLFFSIFLLLSFVSVSVFIDRSKGISFFDKFFPKRNFASVTNEKIVNEESIVIDIAEKASPSVVTVSIQTPERNVIQFNPFGGGFTQKKQGGDAQDIGSGFVVSKDGLIVTNKHVVADQNGKYKVITKDGKEFDVKTINRDPSNDLAILKIDANSKDLVPLELGSSESLKVGQFVMAIGTALGEFRHTVTTGVISGLGRGITAGDPYEGSAEKLDDVIQTDAAINPGNSGGPLLNSAGQVVGVNVAVAQGAQNIGFALPVNILKKGLSQFSQNGSFASKAFLGVQYQMVGKQAALLNNVPQGAYVVDVVSGSPADKSGIKEDDIITEIDSEKLSDNKDGLSGVVAKKNPGDTISVKLWRDNQELTLKVSLTNSSD